MLEIKIIPVSPFQQNCRIVGCSTTKVCVVVDPGGEADRISKELTKLGYRCVEIWLTHSHLDHCGGVKGLKELTNAPVIAHAGESFLRSNVSKICEMYGIYGSDMEDCPEPDKTIDEGETLSVGEYKFKVLFTPGHSPGHLCFYCEAEGVLLAGDTVFSGSIGRTDLPGGDHRQLLKSIKEKILVLPKGTKIMPGHGPDTNVEIESKTNPFIQE